ncbi:MAG: rhomboid family intramembrane serine protease [Bacteroidetes bacterium]|nr:rhomboid family intramembrane serine protease [Bacteroidota bacterium]MBS1982155.1 rhomboid family intramembrane serine protease [Bacteroidota bacterium]
MWLVFTVEVTYNIDLGYLGIYPRTFHGLAGILFAPLLHGSLGHLFSNTFPLLFLGTLLYFFYDRIGGIVFFRCYFITNFLVWLLSPRLSYHIGASGLIYGLASFLILFGILRQDFLSLTISLIIMFVYGGAILSGVAPTDPHISWEAHLFGALTGVVTAFDLANRKKIR